MNQIIKILWLAPNLNHYKARFLNYLAKESDIELTLLSGIGRKSMGDVEISEEWVFKHQKLNVTKSKFGTSKLVRKSLKKHFNSYDWILIPAEKKNLLLFLYANSLKSKSSKTKLFSYNHPILKSGNGKISFLDRLITKYYYEKFDRVIFYTKQSCKWAIQQNLIKPSKAFWANNTLDTNEISKHYSFSLPNFDVKSIVFIGRLIPSKRLDLLIAYFENLQGKLPKEILKLEIIGDGPEKVLVEKAIEKNANITWHGGIIDEAKISPIMKKTAIVFIPGHSGLSVNHAFAYGRPYITLQGSSHAPEINYIKHGVNGYILDESEERNLNKIATIISDENQLKLLCKEAQKSGEELSVMKWIEQVKTSLKND